MMDVVIGVDPHKMSVTIEVVDHHEQLLGSGGFGTDKTARIERATSGHRRPTEQTTTAQLRTSAQVSEAGLA